MTDLRLSWMAVVEDSIWGRRGFGGFWGFRGVERWGFWGF